MTAMTARAPSPAAPAPDKRLDLPSLGEFFQTHGAAVGSPRVIRPYLQRCFRHANAWLQGELPAGRRHLAICIPPRQGKTLLARDIIAYALGLWPDSEFIYTSYAAELAVAQTYAIRNVLNSAWYRSIFPGVGPADGQQHFFRTRHGGSVLGVGNGGAITGFGAGKKRSRFGGAVVIDDPLKADEARSETARRRLHEWFTGTLLSRRNHDRTPILLIAQRLHPEDLVGRIRRAMAADWHFLEIPALAPNAADTIWPKTFSRESAERLREIDPFAFCSQYQQEPVIPGGALIKSDWWRFFNEPAEAVRRRCDCVVITADTAYTEKEAGDYSVFQAWGFEGRERIYLLDQIRGRWGWEKLVPAACAFWDKHGAGPTPVYRMYIENKASGQSLVQQHELFRERRINAFPWNSIEYGPRDKVGRVKESVIPIFAGQVILPGDPGAAWVDDFIAECAAFSEDMSQSHDDQVDAMTMAILVWRGLAGGRSGKAET